ncbi:MAG: hypothetical protein DWQ05_19915 [Calditrichaeota bacterium]|nr:MAG: hypothetical protein DWQ05_19915 [Calditrichota bacterium]
MEESYFEDEEIQGEGSIDITRFWRAILKKWWLWSIVTMAVSIPWVLFVKAEKPIYQATSIIQFQQFDGQTSQQALQYQIQRLTSRSFAEEIVKEMGLVLEVESYIENRPPVRHEIFSNFSTSGSPVTGKYVMRFPGDGTMTLYKLPPEDEPEIAEQKLHFGYVKDDIDSLVTVNGLYFKLANKLPVFPDEVFFNIKNFRSSVSSFQDRVNINFGRTGSIMEVTLNDHDPFLVAEMTNRLAQIYIRETVVVTKGTEGQYGQLLRERLDSAEQKMRAAQDALSQYRALHGMDLAAELKKLNTDLTRYKENYEILRDNNLALTQLKKKIKTINGGGEINPEELNTNLRDIYHQILELSIFENDVDAKLALGKFERYEKKYDDQVRNTSEKNKKSIEFATELIAIFKEIDAVIEDKFGENKQELRQLNETISSINFQLKKHPKKLAQYTRLEEDEKNARTIWEIQKSSYDKFALTSATESTKISIMDEAIPPDFPINRNKKTKAAVGVIASFFLGIVIVIGIEFLDKSLKSVIDVKNNLKVNVLGTIPDIDFEDLNEFQDDEKARLVDNQLVTHNYSPTPIGEAYRSLRTSIMFSKAAGRVQTLVITSIAPGDGKSFTAANLAITMAQHKSNTLLVDTDLRRGVLHNTFGIPKEPGFSTYLTNNIPIPEVIQETHIPNLSVVSCGALIPNPSELLGSHQMKRFLDEVRRRFDLIIFDTPPLNAATDAVVIGTQVDANVLVVRAGKTQRDVAKQKMELYHHVPAKIIGAILNGAGEEYAHEGYSYYHY